MIQANELRVGNIFWEDYGGYKQVAGIRYSAHEGHVIEATGIGYSAVGEYSLKHCFPVKLTGAILSLCGLEERYTVGEWSWAKCTPGIEWKGYTEIRKVEEGFQYLTDQYPVLKYLHDLQNLYKDITRADLIFKIHKS